MRRFTPPRERAAARSRQIKIVYKDVRDITTATSCLASAVERTVGALLRSGAHILSVDGVRVPHGYSGDSYFDSDGSGPYWKDEL